MRWFPQQRLNLSVTVTFLAQQDFPHSLEEWTPDILGMNETAAYLFSLPNFDIQK